MKRHRDNIRNIDLPLLEGLDSYELDEWNAIASVCTLDSGEVLYSQGERAQSFYIILAGGVQLVEYTPEGKAVTVKVYGKGDMLGLLSLTEVYTYVATVKAVDHTRIIAFRSDKARELLTRNGLIAMRLLDSLTHHVHHAHDRIRHLAAEKTEQRLARALLHFYHKFGQEQGGIYIISADLSQRDISEFTGTTLETVNRYLRAWEKSGWIQLSYKHIDILNPYELEALAASVTQHGYMPE